MASSRVDMTKSPPKALTFDVFGTVVNWRKTVTETLVSSAQAKVDSSSRSAELPPQIRRRVAELTPESWGEFAQQWRNTYKTFVRGYDPDTDAWRDVDAHHLLSLQQLLRQWGLEGLYAESEVEDLSKVWHVLEPWPDAASGLQRLGRRFITSTLSNGNQSLLKDLDEHGKLAFRMLQSSADFKAYKPHPTVYLGAARAMRVQPGEIAMVAAHLNDLKAAREQGFRTIFVERPAEEEWSPGQEEYEDAKTWVDMWVSESENGFEEVARRFGLD
ncbi:MAG: hypothetical protein M1818_004439 [Claussenomyces sp. TS43310]|nr:MAG: hypothetical protein M1818_004439 [Claussenomyces sp. TS43310]